MKKKDKKLNKAMKEKVTAGQFFKVQWKILKELYEKYKLETTGIILLSLVTMCTSFIELKFLEFSTNSVSGFMNGNAIYSFKSTVMIIGLFLFALLIMRILSNTYNIISQKYQSKIVFEVEKKIINKLSNISYEYHESNAFHEKINLARQASEQYSKAVYGVTQIVNIVLMLIVYGFMLSKINLFFIGVIFLSVGISIVIAASVTDKQLDYWRTHVSPESRRNYYFRSVFANRINQQNIQTGRTYPYFGDKYNYYNKRERRNYLKLNLLSFSTEISTAILFLITFFFTALIVGKGVVSGVYEIGYYSMVIALLSNLFTTMKQFAMFMLNGNWYVKVLDTYYEVMKLDEDTENNNATSEKAIEVNGLKYKYPQAENYALKGINISFEKGEKIAVVGHNGSGKTTLISVILGLLKQCEGSYGQNNIICTGVLQNFVQYQMTVKENIEIGCGGKKLPEDKIIDILKKVDLYNFIAAKPDGIYTKLGQLEEGVELSKGQWQRLAIGRLLANEEANVWILDEPTAFLDPLAEVKMYEFIFNLAGDRLVFFISHRLGFAKNADRIIVVNDGAIAEDGTHKKLILKSNGLYAQMFEAQKEWYM